MMRRRRPNPVIATALAVAVLFSVIGKVQADAAAAPVAPARTAPVGPNVDFVPLAAGAKPPQFIVFSFDGAGSHEKWQTFMATAEDVGAQFTGFLSGVYLLTDEHAAQYTGPGHAAGRSSIGFGGTRDDLATLITDLNRAYLAGMEIGTHYNGHFCDGSDPSGNDWSTEQWTNELTRFFRFLTEYRALNDDAALPALVFGPEAVQGGRTPCLEGEPDTFFPALTAHGMTYDSSVPVTGLVWPRQSEGVWEFGMPVVPVAATGRRAIAMDYNFWYQFNGATEQPARAGEFTAAVLDTYESMFAAAYGGNRAPLVIGNHFNNWSGDAFNPAAEAFMRDACRRPETVCTTYQNVIGWMQAQTPQVLTDLQALPPSGV